MKIFKILKTIFLHISNMLKTKAVFILLINAYIYFKRTFLSGRYFLFTLVTTLVTLLELIFGVVFGPVFSS